MSGLDRILHRDRIIVGASLALISATAWVYVIYLARQMDMGNMDMSGFRMAASAAGMIMRPAFQSWTIGEFAFTFIMWAVMMIGMMTPSAAPMILLYARTGRQAASQGKPFASTLWFLGGYLLTWSGFSFAATAAQWGLDRVALLTSAMSSASPVIGGLFLIAAGVYQWTPLKDACLTQCQSPMHFIFANGGFRRAALGSLRMGAKHGFFCVGCCWGLMLLLFVGGVMNVLWIAVIAILVLAEKVIPGGKVLPRTTGGLLAIAGLWLLVHRA